MFHVKMFKFTKNLVFIVIYMQLSSSVSLGHLMFTKCSMQDSVCLTRESRAVLRTFVNGIPELGVEKLDKMFIDSIETNRDNKTLLLKNVEVEGFKDASINEFSFDEIFKVMRISFNMSMLLRGDYAMMGNLLRQPMNGVGTTTYELKNFEMDIIFFYDIIKQESGKNTMDLIEYRYGHTLKGGIKFGYTNLFPGDERKSEIALAFINKNWRILMEIFSKDILDVIFDKIFKSVRAFLSHMSLEDLILY